MEGCHYHIIREIENSSKSKLISKSDALAAYIRNISNQISSQNCAVEPVSINFKSEILPDYLKGDFIIENFSMVKEEKEIVYSDPLTSVGVTWRLKVYPNGNGQARGNYLSVFLEMTRGYSAKAKYDYKIEMENCVDHDLNVSREYTSEFEVGECWGYNRFFNSNSIQEENFIDREDRLRLKFYVRASSYAQQSSDQSKYIDKLEAKIASLKYKLLINNIKISEDGEKDESERDEEDEDETIDKHPVNQSNIEQDANSSCDEEEEKLIHKRKRRNEFLQKDEFEFDKESNPLTESQMRDVDIIENDSMHEDEYCPGSGLVVEERKQMNNGDLSDNSEEIVSKIDEFRQTFMKNRISQDILPSNRDSLENGNVLLDNEDNEQIRSSADDHFNDFMKVISESENQIQQLNMMNKSFKGEMKAKFEGYEVNSDEESEDANYEENKEDEHSNTSDGNLSREEEKKVTDEFVHESIKKHLIDVSPESPLRVLSRCTKNDNKLYEDILLRDVLNEYADDLVNNSMMADQMGQRKSDISTTAMNRNSHKLTPDGKVMGQRKATWKKSPPKDEN